MRRIYPLMLVAVVALLAHESPAGSTATEDKKGAEKTESVAAEDLYTTQAGPPARLKDWTNRDEQTLEAVKRAAMRVGPSNVFLVRGNSFRDAVGATEWAFGELGHTGKADEAFPRRLKDADVWVVTFLGTGSSDRCAVRAVERTGARIRVSYVDRGGVLGDIVAHFAWARLGRLEPGKYTAELYDLDRNEVTLSRLVRVEK